MAVGSGARALAAFAKAPLPGAVKTRLMASLTPAAAAELAGAFIDDTALTLVRAAECLGVVPVLLYTPSDAREAFRERVLGAIELIDQRDGGLDVRLERAFAALHQRGFSRICAIGSDSPTLPLEYIGQAYAALDDGADVAIGPSEDGGYYLVGMRKPRPELFAGVSWSTAAVFEQTMARAKRLGLDVAVLPEWYDVDDETSLRRLQSDLAKSPSVAPKTCALMERLCAISVSR